MSHLLDTHALIWFFEANPRLSTTAKNVIESKNNPIYVSIASFWEISIKISLGKLEMSLTIDQLYERCEKEEFVVLPTSIDHIRALQTLPYHHRDPFDRMLIAQANIENCTLITIDTAFEGYAVSILW